MNFYELFEKKESDHQDVTIADPKAALALKTARNKYSYADNDLEAFIKMTQDQDEEEQNEIDQLERDTERQEKMIAKNKELVTKLRDKEEQAEKSIDALERETMHQENLITQLRAAEAEYEQAIGNYSQWANGINAKLADLDQRTDAALNRLDVAVKSSVEIPPPPKVASKPKSTVASRRFKN